MSMPLPTRSEEIRYLKGVGPKRALALEKIGIRSVRDLLYFFPRRYEDRSRFRTIQELKLGEAVTLRVEILKIYLRRLPRMMLFEMVVGDSTGVLHAVWFNQPYLRKQFSVGQKIILFGKIEFFRSKLQMQSPEYEILEEEEEAIHTGRITPVYPLTEGLFQRSLRTTLHEALAHQLDRTLEDHFPRDFRDSLALMELKEAVQEMHFPTSFETLKRARTRIVFDEFFLFEIRLMLKMKNLKTKYRSHPLRDQEKHLETFKSQIPFILTPSQEEALRQIFEDLKQSHPMNRLLQGDVGSGKTVVAAGALYLAAQNGLQGALLVPTELLAEQHYKKFAAWLGPLQGKKVGLLTSSTPQEKRQRLLAELKQNKIAVLIGTHALIQEDVKFQSLALLVTDEQHKFGVHQRCKLLYQDPRPHQLVMTATPIPRTLALTLYGDLKTSCMKELPRGRKPVKTYWIKRSNQPEILRHVRQEVSTGHQAYFIFPLIQETEKSDMLAATKEYEKLRLGIFRGIPMGLVHGRLEAYERDSLMTAFHRGEIKILVATSVIEVGVDNPNATLMIIENAERFGLSQLHQMRGRIGRGEHASECFLFGEPKTEEGNRRLQILTQTQDGFVIAEEDLKLRGPGEFFGTRQSGEFLFRIGNPMEDEALLLQARECASRLVESEVFEKSEQWQATKNLLDLMTLKY
ncbi:MAG: ATP-dependent DNA helicase RecG [Candidatus Omnitrophica bacterium]|nr:ATP-dependent DNA helicase RecG [Candidatus Omnitrophota bacterium]